MLIRFGYKITFECPGPTPIVCQLDVHPSRLADMRLVEPFTSTPAVLATLYLDQFGNHCRGFLAPLGSLTITSGGILEDSGMPDSIDVSAPETPVAELPSDCLVYLVGSRYCETDKMSQIAWDHFGSTQPGWARVQSICDFVHNQITFGYQHARSTRTAFEAFHERVGVCRDFAHLAVTLCRCMNIPARYVNGYLGDIGVPVDPAPMDFSAWFEAYVGGRWHTFDARHNRPRIGRILIARGRDAADIPLINSFGPHELKSFEVYTAEA